MIDDAHTGSVSSTVDASSSSNPDNINNNPRVTVWRCNMEQVREYAYGRGTEGMGVETDERGAQHREERWNEAGVGLEG